VLDVRPVPPLLISVAIYPARCISRSRHFGDLTVGCRSRSGAPASYPAC
jgi:hypothetical protein